MPPALPICSRALIGRDAYSRPYGTLNAGIYGLATIDAFCLFAPLRGAQRWGLRSRVPARALRLYPSWPLVAIAGRLSESTGDRRLRPAGFRYLLTRSLAARVREALVCLTPFLGRRVDGRLALLFVPTLCLLAYAVRFLYVTRLPEMPVTTLSIWSIVSISRWLCLATNSQI